MITTVKIQTGACLQKDIAIFYKTEKNYTIPDGRSYICVLGVPILSLSNDSWVGFCKYSDNSFFNHTELVLLFRIFGFTLCNSTFNNISVMSWQSALLVEETGVTGENHRSVASH